MAISWLGFLIAAIGLPLLVREARARKWLVWAIPAAGLALLALYRDAAPALRLVAASAGMIYAFKGAVLASYPRGVARTSTISFLLWPGMDPESLAKRGEPNDADAYPVARGLLSLYLGIATLLVTSLTPIPETVKGWLGLAGILMITHFGISVLLSSAFRLTGRAVRPLFDRPLAARTLNEFWTKRWNIAFVELDRRLFLPPLLRRFGFRWALLGVFLISGLLHEMAISYPAGGDWGLPTLYFLLQGILMLLERRLGLRSRIFTWAAVLAPLPLVFTSAFRSTFVLPAIEGIHSWLVAHPASWYADRGLWIMAAAHFLVLVASFQVPGKLKWREELPRLSSFNRKLVYAYGAFIMLTIVTFGAFTLAMHQELLAGSKAALFMAGFITVFWLLRIALDAFYYKHEDWPKGTQFVIGHALLTSLFAFLSLSYGGLVVWHLLIA